MTIRFRFQLSPLDEVRPWGGERPVLHWFALTDGVYGLHVDGHELLGGDGVDYYVVRLWEDVNTLTPCVLESVPADLQQFIASELPSGDVFDTPMEAAVNWYGEHYLDLGYLRDPPRLRFWRTIRGDRDEVTVTDGLAVRCTVPASEYLDAVHALDRELMAAMGRRVDELQRRGGLAGVAVDLAGLRREHEDRQHWLARNLACTPDTDWDEVRRGARLLLAP